MSGQSENFPKDSNGKFDVDNFNPNILIICRAKPPLEVIGNYLNRRGWNTLVVREVSQAFKLVTTFKPHFVLLSVNLQVNRLEQLPIIFNKQFNIPVVTFGETLNSKTLRRMQEIASNYSITGVLSGPAVHRRIKQIAQQIFGEDSSASNESRKADSARNERATVVIEGAARRSKPDAVDPNAPPAPKNSVSIISTGNESRGETTVAIEFEEESDVIVTQGTLSTKIGSGGDGAQLKAPLNDHEISELANQFAGIDFDDEIDSNQESMEDVILGELGEERKTQKHVQTEKKSSEISQKPSQVEPVQGRSEFPNIYFEAIYKTALESVLAVIESAEAQPRLYCSILPVLFGHKPVFTVTFSNCTLNEESGFLVKFRQKIKEVVSTDLQMSHIADPIRINKTYELKEIESWNLPLSSWKFTLGNGSGRTHFMLLESLEFVEGIEQPLDEEKIEVAVADLVPEMPVGVFMYILMKRNEKFFLYLRPESLISSDQKLKLLRTNTRLFINKKDLERYKTKLKTNQTAAAKNRN